MERITAADNLTIELDDARWRLIANGTNGTDEAQVLVEALPGQPVRYVSGFASSRRLPASGALTADDIQRVVLGWSEQDSAWHLGLLLAAPLAATRGSRWCEIARWPDPDTTRHDAQAARAGAELAQMLDRPFARIAPQTAPAAPPAEAETQAAAMPPLPEPPLDLDGWTLKRTDTALELVRAPAYARGLVRRSIWYAFWVVVYVVLIITNFTSGIAPARPEILPYVGLLAAVVLTALVVRNIYWLRTQPNRIVVDPAARTITALRGSQQRWRFAAGTVEAVYASQVAERSRSGKATYTYGELNLQLADGRFWFILSLADGIESLRDPENGVPPADITTLTPAAVYTALQAAGAHIAAALAVPCRDDRRAR